MQLTGQQVDAMNDFLDGEPCDVAKLGGEFSDVAMVTRTDKTVVWIHPDGQIMDEPPNTLELVQ